jgi:hypothetical protein
MNLSYDELMDLLARSYYYIGNEPCSEKELDEVMAIRDAIRYALNNSIVIYWKQTIV